MILIQELYSLLIDNGHNIKIIHQTHERGQDKINSGNSPGHQYRHPDIVVEHERGKDVARHGCKGYGKTALEHPVLKTWKMASFP